MTGGPGREPPGRNFFRRPRGYIDWPRRGRSIPRAPAHLIGWCLFPGASVARVEVSVNGGPPERARLAMERPDLRASSKHPDAPIAGFEHKVDLTGVPPATRTLTLEATAHSTDGRTLHIKPATYDLEAPAPPERSDEARAGELQARSLRSRRQRGPRERGAPWMPAREGRLRLLAFSHVLVHGGGSLYLLELLSRLNAEPGFHCEVVTLADGPLRPHFEERGIPVHLTDSFPVTSMERYEGHMAELLAWAAAGDFDAVLANTLGTFTGADLATRLDIPCIWPVHESFTLPMFWHAAFAPGTLAPHTRAQAERAFRSAAAVVFQAEATRRLFLEDAPPERLVTIPYGAEFDAIDKVAQANGRQAVRRELGIDEDARVVLCLGSIEPRKGQAMLAAAFAQIADRHPDAQLVLVGETEERYSAEYTSALHEYVRRAKLSGRIRIEPVTPDPYRWHAVADLLVCASDIESLPRVTIEAMAFGTPVLSTRVFGVPELIEDGRNGYLCEMRDLGDLVRGLDRALEAPQEEREAIARAASEHVRARHDPAAYARQMAALIEGLVADPQALPAEVLAREPSAARDPAPSGAA